MLLRVHAMRAQMAGARAELSALQGRVNRYDGFTKGIVDRFQQPARPPRPPFHHLTRAPWHSTRCSIWYCASPKAHTCKVTRKVVLHYFCSQPCKKGLGQS